MAICRLTNPLGLEPKMGRIDYKEMNVRIKLYLILATAALSSLTMSILLPLNAQTPTTPPPLSPWFCTSTTYKIPACFEWASVILVGPTPAYFVSLIDGSEIDPDENDWSRFKQWATDRGHVLPTGN